LVSALFATGKQVERMHYDSFGNSEHGGNIGYDNSLSDAVTVGYLGLEFDFEAKVYLESSGRYYNPSGGRYLTASNMHNGTLSLYAFANNTSVDRSNAISTGKGTNTYQQSGWSTFVGAFHDARSSNYNAVAGFLKENDAKFWYDKMRWGGDLRRFSDWTGNNIFVDGFADYVDGTERNLLNIGSFGLSDDAGMTNTSALTGFGWEGQKIAFEFSREVGTIAATMGAGTSCQMGRAGQALKWIGIGQDAYDTVSNGYEAHQAFQRGDNLTGLMHLGFAGLGAFGVVGGLRTKAGCFTGSTQVVLAPKTDDIFSQFGTESSGLDQLATVVERKTLAIKSVELGMRVVADNPRPWEVDDEFTEPEAATWRKICAVVFRADGGVVRLELLRPLSWIEQWGLRAGQTIPMQLSELNVDGLATIQSIEESPPIAAGEGRVVLGRFQSYCVDDMVTMTLSNGTVLDVTSVHLFWSETRQDWVAAGELQVDEQLNTLDGPVTVTSIETRGPESIVYNLEVHGEHVYRVAEAGVLVHNTYGGDAAPSSGATMPRSVPLGFASAEEFAEFGTEGYKALKKAKYNEVAMHFQGSSVTGHSFSKVDSAGNKLPFRPESDFDIALSGKSLFEKARKLGIEVGRNPSRIGPLTSEQINALGLRKFHGKLESLANGREVNFMLFQNQERVMQWSADTIHVIR
jgi:hypothetical protein